jgi:hypothetical protein
VSNLLFWVVSCILFLVAVACAVFAALVRGDEHPYLFWAAWAAWAVLCAGVALVVRSGLL